MFADIEPRSPVPLYEQIAARVRMAVAAGDVVAGTALPSVRQLAGRLRVNPATVVQAYRELEREGFVEMRQGAGTFIREVSAEQRVSERTKQARSLARVMLAEAARLGLEPDEIMSVVRHELGARSA